jgi:hypothetical protein
LAVPVCSTTPGGNRLRTQISKNLSHKSLKSAGLTLFSISALFLAGCGIQPFTESAAHTLTVKGTAFGGQPPVSGSSVTLYATGQSGYGSAATSLGSTTSDASGNFNIGSAIGCSDPEQVYIVATGGNPGLTAGTNNNGLVLVAALGNCSSVSASTHVIINEVTTVAAAYALSGFAGTGVNIGTSATNSLGLQHAFQNAANIVDSSSGNARSTTPAGNGTVPAAAINSLADILEPCVNSTSASSSTCTTLLSNAAPPAVTSVSAPLNTWQAALDMAQYPGNNTATLYGLILGTPSFQPTLGSTPPNDLSIGVLYTAGLETDAVTTATFPFGIAADASDNIWITGMTGAGLVELSSAGAVKSPAGGYGNSTLQAASTRQVAVDLHGNIITVDIAASPNVYIYNPTANTTTTIQPGGLPLSGVAIDSNNNIWYSSRTSATSGQALGQLAYNSGTSTFATTPTTFSVSTPLPGTGTYALTVDATNNNVWAPNQSAGATNYFLAPYNVAPGSLTTGDSTNYAVAIDKNDNAWIAGTGSGANGSHLFLSPHGTPSILQATYQPTVTAGTGLVCGILHGCGLYNPRSLMVDGNNRIFISSFSAGMIVEFDPSVGTTGGNPGTFYLTAEGNGFNPSNNQTNYIAPTASTTPSGLISTSAPRTLAIDAAGALWTVNASSTGPPAPVVQILGVAAPTVPVLAQGKYGVKP